MFKTVPQAQSIQHSLQVSLRLPGKQHAMEERATGYSVGFFVTFS